MKAKIRRKERAKQPKPKLPHRVVYGGKTRRINYPYGRKDRKRVITVIK